MTLHVHTKTAPKANHPHFLPKKIRLLKGSSSSRHRISVRDLSFLGEEKMMFFCNGRPPFATKKTLREGQDKFKAISDEEEDTTFRRLAMEDVLGVGSVAPRSVGFWVGKAQETTTIYLYTQKKKVRVRGYFPRLFQKKHPGEILFHLARCDVSLSF